MTSPDTRAAAARSSSYLPNESEKSQDQRLQKNLDAASAKAAEDRATGHQSAGSAVTTVDLLRRLERPVVQLADRPGGCHLEPRVTNVRLGQGNSSQASRAYYEGSDPSCSDCDGGGHGSGSVVTDYD